MCPSTPPLIQGQLKLIDFGIAKSIQGDTTSISRESQVRGREAGNEGEEAESRVEKEEGRGKRGSRVWRRMEERDVPSPRMAQPPPTDP